MRLGTNPTSARRATSTGFSVLAADPGLVLGIFYLGVFISLLGGLALCAVVKLSWRVCVLLVKAVRGLTWRLS